MAFLDNFSFAFQPIILKQKNYSKNKYGEKVEESENNINFLGIILEKGDFKELDLDNKKLFSYSSKDFELRSPLEIKPKMGDIIVNNDGIIYEVVYTETIYFNGKKDHNLSIIRLQD